MDAVFTRHSSCTSDFLQQRVNKVFILGPESSVQEASVSPVSPALGHPSPPCRGGAGGSNQATHIRPLLRELLFPGSGVLSGYRTDRTGHGGAEGLTDSPVGAGPQSRLGRTSASACRDQWGSGRSWVQWRRPRLVSELGRSARAWRAEGRPRGAQRP